MFIKLWHRVPGKKCSMQKQKSGFRLFSVYAGLHFWKTGTFFYKGQWCNIKINISFLYCVHASLKKTTCHMLCISHENCNANSLNRNKPTLSCFEKRTSSRRSLISLIPTLRPQIVFQFQTHSNTGAPPPPSPPPKKTRQQSLMCKIWSSALCEHQGYYISSWGRHNCRWQIKWQSIS